jgi:citrate lyase subunit alpha/citrate CoA-transferase
LFPSDAERCDGRGQARRVTGRAILPEGISLAPGAQRPNELDKLKGSDLPIKPIEQIKEEVEALVGGSPEPPRVTDNPVAVVKWVDGTVLDTVWQVVE